MRQKRVYIIGPSLKTQGGISSVMRIHISTLSNRYDMRVIPTYLGQGRLCDILLFGLSILRVCWLSLAIGRGNAIFHIHSSTGGSFFRKRILVKLLQLKRHIVFFHMHAGDFDQQIAYYPKKYHLNTLSHCYKFITLSDSWHMCIHSLLPELSNITTLVNPCPNMLETVEHVDIEPRPDTAVRIVFTGKLCEDKGVYDLLRACERIAHLNYRLDLYGNGEIEKVTYFIQQAGLEEKVKVFGWVDFRDIYRLYSQYDIFVLPSYLEGMPMSLLEAMYCALPVVATRIKGITDCVTDNINGFLHDIHDDVKLSEILSQLIQDPALRLRMGRNAREIARTQFDPIIISDRLAALYDEAFRGGSI